MKWLYFTAAQIRLYAPNSGRAISAWKIVYEIFSYLAALRNVDGEG